MITQKKLTLVMAAVACTAGAAMGSTRVTLFEEFTADWCGYCPYMAGAFLELLEDNPDSVVGIMIHISDDYATTWGNQRANFYGVGGIPHGVFDGQIEVIGGSPGMNLSGYFNTANAQATDVTIDLQGEIISSNQYRVTCEVGIENGGSSKTMRLHLLQCYNALDWPESNEAQFNTVRQAMASMDVTVGAGNSHTFNHTFTLNGESLANTSEATFIAWAQSTANGDPAPVYNAAMHRYGEAPPADVVVGPGGDYTSIQDAIDAVGSGSTVTVLPGTYYGPVNFNGRSITLVSTGGAEVTIIDAQGAGPGLSMTSNESPSVTGFTVKNGASTVGSGARVASGAPSISECIFRDNTSSSNYVIFSTGNPSVSDTNFCNNSHNTIGGNWIDGGGNSFDDNCGDEEPCEGDATGDGAVDVNDILEVIANFGATDGSGDANGDGVCDVNDILAVVGAYGSSC